MDQISRPKVSCPNCGSDNVLVMKRGYSLGLGLVGMVVFFIGYMIIWIVSTDYASQDATTQGLMVSLAERQFIIAGLLGLLVVLIGKNKLKGKCVDCKKKFTI